MSQRKIDFSSFIWAGGIEDTFIPQAKDGMRPLEEYELTQHYSQWREDLDRAASLGITKLRWGVPWFRVETQPGRFNWSWVDQVLDYMINTLHIDPIVDLVHYGTPIWMCDSFVDPCYPQRVAFYAQQFAKRYGHMVKFYTALNEPTVNADFSGRRGEWPPYLTGDAGYTRVMLAIADGMQRTIHAIREVDPEAVFVAVEAMHLYRVACSCAATVQESQVAFAKDLLCWDLVRGAVDVHHILHDWLLKNGATERQLTALRKNAVEQDVCGVNLYPWSTFDLLADCHGKVHWTQGPDKGKYLQDVLERTYSWVGKPLMVTETSAPGDVARRRAWMVDTVSAVRAARRRGIPVVGYTWFPLMTMVGWEYRLDDKPIDQHLLHLGLWDSAFDDQRKLVRRETPLVEAFRGLVSNGMPPTGSNARTWLLRLMHRFIGRSA